MADITYPPTAEGWLYLAAVLDLATCKIVGWSMRDHMRTELTSAALMMVHSAHVSITPEQAERNSG